MSIHRGVPAGRLRLILTFALFGALAAAPLHAHDLRGSVSPELVQVDDARSQVCSACRFGNETVDFTPVSQPVPLSSHHIELADRSVALLPVSLPARSGRAPPLV